MKTSIRIIALALSLSALAALPMGCANMASSTSSQPNKDADLSDRVMTRMSAETELAGVQAEASQGIVTLRGTVRSGDDKDRAARVAASVLGVEGVKSAIVVQ